MTGTDPGGGPDPRSATALAFGLFVVSYGTNVSTPFLVLYRERLLLGPSQTMAIFVVYVAGILSTLLITGPLSDRLGRRPVVLPMVAASAVGSGVMILGRDEFVLLLVGRFLLGVASGGALGVGAAWLQELLGHGNEQRAAITTTLVTFGGFGIGPPVSALFEWLLPDPLIWPFVLHVAVSLVAFVFTMRVRETRRPSPGSPLRISLGVPSEARSPFFRVIVPAAIWVFAFPSAGFALFPVLVSESVDGSDVAVAAITGALTAWAGLAARPLVGRIGPRRALPVGMVMGLVGYVLGYVAFSREIWQLVLLAGPLFGGASGALTAGCLSLLGAMADAERRGALTATFYLLAYPGMAMPLVITGIGSVTSLATSILIITGLCALCSAAIVATFRRVDLLA